MMMLHNNVALGQSNEQVNKALIFAETMHEEAFILVIQIIKVRGFIFTLFGPIFLADYTRVIDLYLVRKAR